MPQKRCLIAALLAVQVGVGTAFAQRGRSRLPEVGTTLPDVTVYDAAGEEFSTKSLRGHYSVLVFGCLT